MGELADAVGAYPLKWPAARPRTPAEQRKRAMFGTARRDPVDPGIQRHRSLSIAEGNGRVSSQLLRLGGRDIVVSTNIPVNKAGAMVKGYEPEDPGVAVYFRLEEAAHCLACDKWDRLADNLAAVAAHLEALRGQARWGVGDLAQAFAGYRALPAMGAPKPWWEVLALPQPPASKAEAAAKRDEPLKLHHPDNASTGDANLAAEIGGAWMEAERYYKAQGRA